MENIFDKSSRKVWEACIKLNQTTSGFLKKKYFDSEYEILKLFGGSTSWNQKILKSFIESGIIEKREGKYFYIEKVASKMMEESLCAKCFVSHQLGTQFGRPIG